MVALTALRVGAVRRWSERSGLATDAVLYLCSSLYALGMGWGSATIAESHWGHYAAPGYATGAVAAMVAGFRIPRNRQVRARLLIAIAVGLAALVGPLAALAQQRHVNPGGNFAQPEVMVVERAASLIWHGHDPYQAHWDGKALVGQVPGVPSYESFFPYFPAMAVFGIPAAMVDQRWVLTDARVVMTLVTVLCLAAGLVLLRLRATKALRVAQWLVILPTGAMFLATGGDDLPLLGLLFLAVALSARHRIGLAALSIAVATALKFTAWPMTIGLALVARDSNGRLRWWSVCAVAGIAVVGTTLPLFLVHPTSFVANVFLFPSGLAHVASPAASPFPGHILTVMWAPLGAALQLLVAGVVVYLALRIRKQWPLTIASMLRYVALIAALIIGSASATRFGYVIYPLNFWVWSYALGSEHYTAAEF